jgi:hypothetical protein
VRIRAIVLDDDDVIRSLIYDLLKSREYEVYEELEHAKRLTAIYSRNHLRLMRLKSG